MKKTNIRVSARVRPLLEESKDGNAKPCFYAKAQGKQKVLIEQGKKKVSFRSRYYIQYSIITETNIYLLYSSIFRDMNSMKCLKETQQIKIYTIH
jgi:hypothetical protein